MAVILLPQYNMPVNVIFTIILWLLTASGPKPASRAFFITCEGYKVWGSDNGDDLPGDVAQGDSRGAFVLEGPKGTIFCRGWKDNYYGSWTILIDRDHMRIDLDMKEGK